MASISASCSAISSPTPCSATATTWTRPSTTGLAKWRRPRPNPRRTRRRGRRVSEASVRAGEAGEVLLAGVIDYSTGPALRKDGQALIKASTAPALVVDCSAVEKSSSVGLALLLAFMRDAGAAGKPVSVRALPDGMREIAHVSGLTELLGQH